MKRITFLLIFICWNVVLSAQEHLTFKNIPIEGSVSAYVAKLEAVGFQLVESTANNAILKGTFAGFDDCTIVVIGSESSNTVWKVVANLPHQVSWTSTCSRYEELKRQYTDKYGKPAKSYEFFIDPYELGDGYELQAIKLEKGYYIAFWDLSEGSIWVEIKASRNSDGWICLGYQDAAGVEVMQQEKDQVIKSDI